MKEIKRIAVMHIHTLYLNEYKLHQPYVILYITLRIVIVAQFISTSLLVYFFLHIMLYRFYIPINTHTHTHTRFSHIYTSEFIAKCIESFLCGIIII